MLETNFYNICMKCVFSISRISQKLYMKCGSHSCINIEFNLNYRLLGFIKRSSKHYIKFLCKDVCMKRITLNIF